jgi:N-acetylglutamate synthase-like GNAT family acetyltransferase
MLREVRPDDPAFVAALTEAGLPTDDLTSEPFAYLCVDDVAWGGVGVGPDALLRSIVVKTEARGRGYGGVVAEALVHYARDSGVQRLWILTTNAAPFFERLGWRIADRATATLAIAQSRQFSGLCPASASLMVRAL